MLLEHITLRELSDYARLAEAVTETVQANSVRLDNLSGNGSAKDPMQEPLEKGA